jgi:hypothetical protein
MMRPYKIHSTAANYSIPALVVTAVGAATAAAILIVYNQKRKQQKSQEKNYWAERLRK